MTSTNDREGGAIDNSHAATIVLDDQAIEEWSASTLTPNDDNHGYEASSLPTFVKPADEIAHEVRARTMRTRLILLSILVIVVGAVLVWLGYQYLMEHGTGNETPLVTVELPTEDKDTTKVIQQLQYETTTIPNLIGFFGLNIEEASDRLDSGWELTKTSPVSDPNNSQVTELATFTYTPEQLTGATATSANTAAAVAVLPGSNDKITAAAAPTANLYLSLNAEGLVIDIYYTADMRVLGYPQTDFMSLLNTNKLLSDALTAAGVSPKDYNYQAPDAEATVTYDNPGAESRKVTKQSTLFSGRTTNEGLPSAWTVQVSYDYQPPIASTKEYQNALRMIYIRLA